MNYLNTLPIESFLEKANISIINGQKSLTLDIKEVESLYDCLALVMTRLSGQQILVQSAEVVTQPNIAGNIKVDGGSF